MISVQEQFDKAKCLKNDKLLYRFDSRLYDGTPLARSIPEGVDFICAYSHKCEHQKKVGEIHQCNLEENLGGMIDTRV